MDSVVKNSKLARRKLYRKAFRMWQVYLLIIPALIYILIFNYAPMYGVVMAFQNFKPAKGIMGSKWVGLKHFERFFSQPRALSIIWNTFYLSVVSLVVGFPFPVILALLMNSVESKHFKKTVQTVTYMPHFISTVVMVGMLMVMLNPSYGVINTFISKLGGTPIFFFGSKEWFVPLYVFSGVWQNMGWSSIVYLAALTGVDPTLHEAAVVDGASRFQRVLHIDFPSILPTVIIYLILNCGRLLSIGFEKIYLMQTSLNIDVSEVISTYVYQRGLIGGEFSFSTAVGLMNSVVNLMMLVLVNTISRKVSETSLW